MEYFSRQPSRYRLFLAVLIFFCSVTCRASTPGQPTDPTGCELLDLTTLLGKAEFMTAGGQPPLATYRQLVSRFITLHYSKIARHLLRDEGDYLNTLHQLVGTRTSNQTQCNRLFRDMLLSSPGPAGFTQALLLLRLTPATTADPALAVTSASTR